jgi:hypothetical protein
MSTPTRSPTAERVILALRPYTPFAEAIVKRQVERAGLHLDGLRDDDLARVGPMIVAAARLFLDPVQLAELKRAIS